MNRFVVPLGIFALLVVVLAVGIRHAPEKGVIQSPLIGKPAPKYDLPNLTDPAKRVTSTDYRGQWHVINVWGTWCPGCRDEHPVLVEIGKSNVVPLVGFDWKDDDAQALDWLSQLGNPYAAVGADHEGRAAIDWGVYGAPETFLVNPQGIVVHKHIGPLTIERWQRDFLPLLQKAGGT